MAARVEFMLQHLRLLALALAVEFAGAARAQTPAPPDWKDSGASVYLGAAEKPLPPSDPAPSIASATADAEWVARSRRYDASVVPSAHAEQIPPAIESDSRHLAPRGARASDESVNSSTGRTNAEPRRLADFGI